MLRFRATSPLVVVLTMSCLIALAGGAEASIHGDRVTFTRDLAFTGSEVAEVPEQITGDIATGGVVYQLGESGSGATTISCPPVQGGAFDLYWLDDSFLNETPDEPRVSALHVRPITDLNLSMSIAPGDGDTSATGQATAAGPVNFQLAVGWIQEGGNALHWHDPWTADATLNPVVNDALPAPPPAGTLQGPVAFEMPMGDGGASILSGTPLAFHLNIQCEDQADFAIGFGGPATMEYFWGEAGHADADGDGMPDQWDMYPDGTEWSYDEQLTYGTDPFDPNDVPTNAAEFCEGYTIQEAVDENPDFDRDDPETCPNAGGFPILLLVLALLIVVLLAGGAFGAVTTMNKKIRMSVSHDGFQDIQKGESAQYELLLTAKGKEDEEVPVEISLKGVPEDWSASVDPGHVTLTAGEETAPTTAILTVTPPPDEEYEAEAVVTVTATPTDEDGKTSPVKPGTSVKTKTIVNIDVAPPEGEKRKKVRKPKKTDDGDDEALQANAGDDADGDEGGDEGGGRFSKMKGLGLLKRKGKKEDEEQEEGEDQQEAEASDEDAQAAPSEETTPDEPKEQKKAKKAKKGKKEAGAAGAGKPDLAVGKLAHEPADFSAGDQVTTTVPVKNKGESPVEGLMLRLYVNDDRVDEKEVDLEPGDASEVTFTWTAQPDENRVRVRGGLKEA